MIYLYGDNGVSNSLRMGLAAKFLQKSGIPTETGMYSKDLINKAKPDDIFVISRFPYPEYVEAIQNRGAHVVIDIDDAFRYVPKKHPGYNGIGMGNPNYVRKMEQAIEIADYATFATGYLVKLHNKPKSCIMPNGYDTDNPRYRQFWKHDGFIVGWVGTITHREDFKLCASALTDFARKHEDVRILIGVDMDLLWSLSRVPAEQKLFVPMLPYEDYPFILGMMDVFVVPLVDDEFNRAKSDVKLVETGAHCIPWIASPVEPYALWGTTGGIFAKDYKEWMFCLEYYYECRRCMKRIAEEGSAKVNHDRKGEHVAQRWLDLFKSEGWL